MAKRCEVCDRVPGRGDGECQRDCASDTVNGYTGIVECLEVALEREHAARERVEKERDAAKAEMHDWYCVGCAQRYDAPPDEGTSRRSCPKCGKWMLFFVEHQREKLAARAAAAEAKAAQYERDWYAAKSEFGEAMAKLRDRANAAESALAQAHRVIAELTGAAAPRGEPAPEPRCTCGAIGTERYSRHDPSCPRAAAEPRAKGEA